VKDSIPRGDMGIGLCLPCITEMAHAEPDAIAAKMPNFGATLAPFMVPGAGMIAVPTCADHVLAMARSAQRKPILMAGGPLR